MQSEIVFKPIFWRLVIWKFVPIYMGYLIFYVIDYLSKGYSYSNLSNVEVAIIMLITIAILSIFICKKYNITISEGKISGQSAKIIMSRETILLSDIDLAGLHRQTLYEKISLFRTIRSVTGQKIMVSDVLYGKLAVEKLYEMLESRNL